jgi:hypothetical protein
MRKKKETSDTQPYSKKNNANANKKSQEASCHFSKKN